jgi:predicted TPR repeat methyltransferase
MDPLLEQRSISLSNISEVIARIPASLRQTIPSHLMAIPSMVLAQRLQSMGRQEEAVMVLLLLLQAEPCNIEVLYQLGLDCNRKGKKEEAIKYMRRHYEERMRANGMNPDVDTDTLQFLLSTEGFAEPPARVPRAYVENLFDRFSDQFDERLVGQLAYKTPELLFEIFCNVAKDEKAFKICKELVDLGCGTGLAGKYFQSICKSLIGVDISSEMVEKSRLRGFYNRLVVSEIMTYLGSETFPIDVFVATDVFNYFGEIDFILTACRSRQKSGGLLAFSVEVLKLTSTNEEKGFKLASSGRFQHERDYVAANAAQADYQVMACEERVLRRENGYDVPGYLFVLKAD